VLPLKGWGLEVWGLHRLRGLGFGSRVDGLDRAAGLGEVWGLGGGENGGGDAGGEHGRGAASLQEREC
jgi:hypothetical protein